MFYKYLYYSIVLSLQYYDAKYLFWQVAVKTFLFVYDKTQ